VRILQRLRPDLNPFSRRGAPEHEAVRFGANADSTKFPQSDIEDLLRPSGPWPGPRLIVNQLGLTGPNGVLPPHYTDMVYAHEQAATGPDQYALRDWLDLFNHRLTALYYLAWEKYRFFIAFEREEYRGKDDNLDPFTHALLSLVGLGTPHLRRRMKIARATVPEGPALAQVDDLALLYFSGLLSHRPRNSCSLQAILADFFAAPVDVCQFQGQWLRLEQSNLLRIGVAAPNNRLGVTTVVGERVWELQSKIRIRVGPLGFDRFLTFLPDVSDVPRRSAFFLLVHLVRLYVGPELDFDVQVVLHRAEVPESRLADSAGCGSNLGWNTWVRSREHPFDRDADDAVFDAVELFRVPAHAGPS
jgi:type VI secretion system protein ImpH